MPPLLSSIGLPAVSAATAAVIAAAASATAAVTTATGRTILLGLSLADNDCSALQIFTVGLLDCFRHFLGGNIDEPKTTALNYSDFGHRPVRLKIGF